MNDLGTISLLVDVRGRPMVTGLANDLNQVAVAETKVSAATQKVMADLQRTRAIMANLKKTTDDTSASFQRFSAKELQQTSQQLKKFETRLATTRRGMGQMGMATQQLGYQVGDFFVQVQSGTNFMVAFGQQATQLVGILPAFSKQLGMSVGRLIGISAGLGIAIPILTAIGAVFMRTGEEADKGAKDIDRYAQALDNLKSSIQSTQADINKLSFGTEDPAIAGARKAMMDAQAEVARLTASQRKIRGQFAPTEEEKAAIAEAVKNYRDLVINLNELTAKQKAYSEAQQMLNGHLSTAKGLVASEADERARHKAILDGINATENDRKNIFHALAGEAGAVSKYMDESFQAGLKLSGLDMATPITAAGLAAEELAAKLGISVGLAAEIGRISAMNADQKRIYSGVKSGLLPDAALNTIGMGGGGITTDVNAPIEIPGAMTPNPTKPRSGGGGKGDPLEQLRQQIALENELLGVSDAQARVIKALGQDRSKYSEAEINAITAEIEAYNQKQEAIARTKQIMDTVKSSMEDAFMSMVDGTKSAKDAFRDMAAMIIKELYRVLVVQQLVNSIAGAIGPIFGGSSAPTSSPRPMPRPSGVAVGGSIMAGGSYLVGENGPELVIPRHSGTVVNANQTAAMGGNSGAVTVNNNINVTGSDAAMVRTEIAKMIPQITNATKAAVIDAKQRGGQMAAAFR